MTNDSTERVNGNSCTSASPAGELNTPSLLGQSTSLAKGITHREKYQHAPPTVHLGRYGRKDAVSTSENPLYGGRTRGWQRLRPCGAVAEPATWLRRPMPRWMLRNGGKPFPAVQTEALCRLLLLIDQSVSLSGGRRISGFSCSRTAWV